jgi:hypothetical protein
MKEWKFPTMNIMNRSYGKECIEAFVGSGLSPLERVLVVALLLTMTIAVLDALQGNHIGDARQVLQAKKQAIQELVAQGAHDSRS